VKALQEQISQSEELLQVGGLLVNAFRNQHLLLNSHK